ncbi:site-specific DNA-methyltransferase, partial [Ruminococcus sp.]|uniref:DNA-methyltransferase n=1 Tax=Ruminococcus sp. TaxID=41978 RepID=UPI00258748DF
TYDTLENGSIDLFYKDVFVENEMIEEGVYEQRRAFADEQDFFNAKINLQAVLAHADAKTILNKLKTESFDMILTDPPYRVISGGTGGKNAPKGMLSKNDGKIFDNNDIQFDEYIPECYRVLKPDRQAYFFTNFLNLQQLIEAVQRAGFKVHNLLVWLKNNATPNRWYMKNCEYVLFCYKGKAKAISNCGSKTVHQFDNIKGPKLHETEKPVELLKMYIENSTEEGEWILDPFAGSGSTMAASLLLNRKVFTCEIDKKYLNVIKTRAISILKSGEDDRNLVI